MNKTAATLLLAASTAAFAADPLLGTYNGSYSYPGRTGNQVTAGIELQVTSVEKGAIRGKIKLSTQGSCAGEYDAEGTSKDGKIALKTKGGVSGCGVTLNLQQEGAKLVGTTARGNPVELSR